MICKQITTYLIISFLCIFQHPGICLGEKKLTLWSINPNTTYGKLTDRMAGRFSRENDGIFLESVHLANDLYKTALSMSMENQAAPDIFHTWGGSSIRTYAQEGKSRVLSGIDDKFMPNYLTVAFDPVTIDGKIHGVPYGGLTGVFFWYRKDVFEQYKIEPPDTWQEFIIVCETLKKNGIIPIALANKNKWPGSFFYMYLVDRIGGPELFNDAFTRKNNRSFLDPAFIKAGERIQHLVKRGFFPKRFNHMRDDPDTWKSVVVTGQAGMYLMGSWFKVMLNGLPLELNKKFDFFVFPVIEEGLGTSDSIVGSPGQDYFSISTDCKHPHEAFTFLTTYINSDDYFHDLANQGFVPPVKNAERYLTDPVLKKNADVFNSARHVQLYYDQVLSPTMAEIHKLLVHQLFELRLTPRQVAQGHENARIAELKDQ